MLLAIDAGNTNIVFALYDGREQVKQLRVETDGFKEIPSFDGLTEVKDIIICSVVPKVNEALTQACKNSFAIEPVFITHNNIDIKINIDKPEQMGTDRLVGASAARALYQAPCVVVDFGTATTFDVIDESATHQGGVIAPGVNLSLQALEQAAAQLPDIKIEKPSHIIGKNTLDAMRSGIYYGYISMIEGVVKRISEEMGAKPFIIATGGLAPLFERGTDIFDITDQDLIIKGLVHMHKIIKNSEKYNNDL